MGIAAAGARSADMSCPVQIRSELILCAIVSGGFAVVQPDSKLAINAVEGYPLEDFSADVSLRICLKSVSDINVPFSVHPITDFGSSKDCQWWRQ